jgi:preprotein translocase subunit SecE
MTEARAGNRGSGRAAQRRPRQGNPVSRLFQSLGLFISQILDELRKVVRPTGSELLNYTIVVIVFVLVIMAIVAGLDFVFHRLMLFLLAG